MNGVEVTLIAIGLIFPMISLVTGIASLIARWRYNKHSSPVFVPFIGPFLLSGVIANHGDHLWLIPIVWVCDIGTVAFLCVTPRLIAEWWAVSRFTQILGLKGEFGNESAVLTLHSTGQYLLKKKWRRTPGELGVIAVGEPGTFTQSKDGYNLIAYHGLRRTLRPEGAGQYVVEEDDTEKPSMQNYSLKHWHLKA